MVFSIPACAAADAVDCGIHANPCCVGVSRKQSLGQSRHFRRFGPHLLRLHHVRHLILSFSDDVRSYDTYMIFNRVSPEEYVTAAISLYLDIINLFLALLQILGAANNE